MALSQTTIEQWRGQVAMLRNSPDVRWGRRGAEFNPATVPMSLEAVEQVIEFWDQHQAPEPNVYEQYELGRKLDMMGITLVNYADPVDGQPTPCIEIQQVAALVKHYEGRIREAVEARPITIKVQTTEQQNELVRMAVEGERERCKGAVSKALVETEVEYLITNQHVVTLLGELRAAIDDA